MASIKQLGERKFKITVSNGYRPDGGKICRAKTIAVPPKVSRRGIDQYVAHAAEELERQIKHGYSEDGETAFETYAENWLRRQTKYAPGTLASYRRMLKVVYPFIGGIRLNALRPMALEIMLAELRKRVYRGKPVQEATVQKYLTVVSSVLSDAKRNEIIQKNPARMIDLPDTERRMQFIPEPEQVRELVKALMNEPCHYAVFYILAIYTGCRRGELCALKWNDIIIDEERQIIIINRSRSSIPGRGIIEGKTKNGRTRIIAVDEQMTWLLISYCVEKVRQASCRGYEMSPYLFTNEKGQLIHPDTFTKHLRKIYDRLGFPKEYHLHTLRHYFVTTLLHGGVDKQTVAELAGHGDTSFLERTYCHPIMDKKYMAAEIMTSNLLVS